MEKKKIKSERLKNERELVKKGKNPFYLKKCKIYLFSFLLFFNLK